MEKRKSLKHNFLMNIILTMSSFIFPLISFPYISRILLPEGTGRVSFATSLITYFILFSQLGIPTYGIRVCAQVRDDKQKLSQTAQELLIINIIMSIVSYVLLALALIYIPRLREDRILYIIISISIILTAIGMEWLYKALEQYTYITIRSIIFKAVALIAMFFLIHEKKDYVIYGGITIFAATASNILNFINVHKYISLKPVKQYDFKQHIKPILVFFAMSCSTTIYTNLDTVMLGFLSTDTDVGYYNAAVKIKTILVSVVASLGTVLLPRASYYIKNGLLDDFYSITKKAIHFVVIIAIPMVVYFIIFAKEGIFFLSGNAYLGAVTPMKIIMPTLFFIGISNICGIQMLIPLGKEKIVLYSEVAGAIVDLVLNALLIPRIHSEGAAIGTLIAEFVVLIVQYVALKEIMNKALKSIEWKKILAANFGCLIIGALLKPIVCGVFIKLIVSSISCFGIYALILLMMKEPLFCEMLLQIKSSIINKFGR